MEKYVSNKKGFTLIEVLAVIVIGTIVMGLIFNVQLFGQKQYKHQTVKTKQLYDVSYVAKLVTREIREAERIKINTNTQGKFLSLTLKIDGGSTNIIELKNNSIMKNGESFTTGISKFEIVREANMLLITIESTDQNGKNQNIKTELYVREGVSIE